MLKSLRIPLWFVLAIQCLLVGGVFATLIAVFATQMRSSTESQVNDRLTARMSTVRATMLRPFLYGQTSAESIGRTMQMDQKSYRINANYTTDARACGGFLRLASSIVHQSKGIIQYISQVSDNSVEGSTGLFSPDGTPYTLPNRSDGLPYITTLMAANGLTNYMSHDLWYKGPDAFNISADTWRTSANFTYSQTFPLNPNGISITKLRSSKVRVWAASVYVSATAPSSIFYTYSIILERASGGRYPGTWLVMAFMDVSSLGYIIRSLTEGSDSVALLYDVSASNASLHTLLATSTTLSVLNPATQQFYAASSSPNADFNGWYADACRHSTEHISPLVFSQSYASTLAAAADAKVAKVFMSGRRFLSYVHVVITSPADGVLPLYSNVTAVTDGDLHLLAVVSTDEDYYLGEQKRVSNTMIAIGVASAIVIAAVCLGVMLGIYLPLKATSYNMGLAALLRNDEVHETTSPLTEVSMMCDAFAKMNAILLAARAFMPASMLVRASDNETGEDDDEDDEATKNDKDDDEGDASQSVYDTVHNEEDNDDEGSVRTFSRSYSRSFSRAKSHHQSDSDAFAGTDKASSAWAADRNTKEPSKNTANDVFAASKRSDNNTTSKQRSSDNTTGGPLKSSLKAKRGTTAIVTNDTSAYGLLRSVRVAVLCVNVRAFTTIADFSIGTISNHTTALMDIVTAAATAERGVIDSFHGDHFVISFNAVKTAAAPAKKAALCSIAISNATSNTPYAALSMGASSGNAIVGPLGNSSQRRLSIVGPCYTKALRLQRASSMLERSVDPLFLSATKAGERSQTFANCFCCLIDKASYAESKDVAETLLLGSLLTPVRTKTVANLLRKMANSSNKVDSDGDRLGSGHRSPSEHNSVVLRLKSNMESIIDTSSPMRLLPAGENSNNANEFSESIMIMSANPAINNAQQHPNTIPSDSGSAHNNVVVFRDEGDDEGEETGVFTSPKSRRRSRSASRSAAFNSHPPVASGLNITVVNSSQRMNTARATIPLPTGSVYAILKAKTRQTPAKDEAKQIKHSKAVNAIIAAIPMMGAEGLAGGSSAWVDNSENDEWMYEMQRKQQEGTFRYVNRATEALQSGNVSAALAAAEERLAVSVEKAEDEKKFAPTTDDGEAKKNVGPSYLRQPTRDLQVMTLVVAAMKEAAAWKQRHSAAATGHHHHQAPRTDDMLIYYEGISLSGGILNNSQQACGNDSSRPTSPVARQEDSKSFDNNSSSTKKSPQFNKKNSASVSGWKGLTSGKVIAMNSGNTNNLGEGQPPLLSNLESAEMAAWLRLSKVLTAVGGEGGVPFVSATSFA